MRLKQDSIAWLAALLLIVLPACSALAYDDYQRAYDDADARVRAAQYTLNRDQADLGAARLRVDELTTSRDRLMKDLAGMRDGSDPDRAKADLDQAMKDRAVMAGQTKSIQEKADAAKVKVDQMHADALAKFESTEAFKTDYAAFDQARQELKGPTDAVLDQLAQTRDFQDLVATARAAKANEDKIHADKNADPQAVKAAEDAFIAADNKVQDAEQKALTADPKVVAGRQKVDAAQGKLRDMRDRMEDDLQKDPAFAAAVDDERKQEAALDTVAADQKKLDAQIATIQKSVDPSEKPPVDNRQAIRDGEAKLDAINYDLEKATQDMAKFDSRVRDDQDGLNYAVRDRDAAGRALGYGPVVIDQPAEVDVYSPYVPVPVVAVPVMPPPVCEVPAWGYGFGGGVAFGFGFSSFYDDRYYGRYYDHYYDRVSWRDRDWRDREWRDSDHDWRDTSRSVRLSEEARIASEQRAQRLRDQSYTEHLAYRERKDIRDTQAQQDRQAYQERKDARYDQAAADRSAYEARRDVRAEEQVHARRAAEDASRSEARQARSQPHFDSVPRQQADPPRAARGGGSNAPVQQPAPRHEQSPPAHESSSRGNDSRSSNNSSNDSSSGSHGRSR